MKKEIISQYYSSLKVLEECIQLYNDEIWFDTNYQNEAWRICYHALFYTNIYCSHSENEIKKWSQENKEALDLNKISKPLEDKTVRYYTRSEMMDFLEHVRGNIEEYVNKMDPEADCWPYWYDQNQFEFHLNNLRHLQHHTAELIERLNNVRQIKYQWR